MSYARAFFTDPLILSEIYMNLESNGCYRAFKSHKNLKKP